MLALGEWSRPDDAEARAMVAALGPEHAKQCPACGTVIMKYDGDNTMMCGCEARPAGGTMAKALLAGGCGHEFNFATGAPIDSGRPGAPANDRQWKFFDRAPPVSVAAAAKQAPPAQAKELRVPTVLLTASQYMGHLRKHSFACVARAHGAGGLPSAQTQALKFHLLAHQHRVTQFIDQHSFASDKQETQQSAARTSPIWIEGTKADSCMLCPPESRVQFWALGPDAWRRHHCRSCGWAVCERCCPSTQRIELDRWVSSTADHPVKYGLKMKRVCNVCARGAPPEVRARQFEAVLAAAMTTAAAATVNEGGDDASLDPSGNNTTQSDLLRQLFPTFSLLHLARELPNVAAFSDILRQYKDTGGTMLDLTDPPFGSLTAAGLAELGVICPQLRRVYFHPSHAAITLHTNVATVDLPTGVKPGESFEFRVVGVAEPLSTVFPIAKADGGRKHTVHLPKPLKQPQLDRVGAVLRAACPHLDASGIQVRWPRRRDMVHLEPAQVPTVSDEVVKNMAKARDWVDALDFSEELARNKGSRPIPRSDCVRCDGVGRVREMRTDVSRTFVKDLDLQSPGAEGIRWLYEDDFGCWKLFSGQTAAVLEQAWHETNPMLNSMSLEEALRRSCSILLDANGNVGEMGGLPSAAVTVQVRSNGGAVLQEVNVGEMTQTNLVTGTKRRVQRASEALGQAGHPCWVCRGSGQISSAAWAAGKPKPVDSGGGLLAWIQSRLQGGQVTADAEGPDSEGEQLLNRTLSDTAAESVVQQCLVCYDDSDFALSTECSHSYCAECIVGSLEGIIETGQFPAWCPQCRADGDLTKGRVSAEAIAFLAERHVITKDFAFRFLNQNDRADGGGGGIGGAQHNQEIADQHFSCPRCKEFLIKPENVQQTTASVVELCMCPHCGTPVCRSCHAEAHFVSGLEAHKCSNMPKLIGDAPDDATMALMHQLGKPCPKCGNFIEKAEGCHIMMCGTNAHGKVSEALRNGGCAFICDWNTMSAADDGHGFTEMNGEWVRNQQPLTARQLAKPDQKTCARVGCEFLFHADPRNNGGTHCCQACKDTSGTHDKNCHKLLPVLG